MQDDLCTGLPVIMALRPADFVTIVPESIKKLFLVQNLRSFHAGEQTSDFGLD